MFVGLLRGVRGAPCARLAARMPVRTAPPLVRFITTEELRAREQRLRAAAVAQKKRNHSFALYSAAALVFALGLTYASVPLYRAFCSATGYSGTPITDRSRYSSPSRLSPSYNDPLNEAHKTERIRVAFNSDSDPNIPWTFTPQQREIYVLPGETALTFYKAHNRSDQDIIGIATYNVVPDRIECFCFEEQKLRAGEEVDLPVFFFIDKDVLQDREARDVHDMMLSYTFFSARRNPKTGQLEPDTDLSKYRVGMDELPQRT